MRVNMVFVKLRNTGSGCILNTRKWIRSVVETNGKNKIENRKSVQKL